MSPEIAMLIAALVGAGIALVASLLTTIVTAALSYRYEKKLKSLEVRRRFEYQQGRTIGASPEADYFLAKLGLDVTSVDPWKHARLDNDEELSFWMGWMVSQESKTEARRAARQESNRQQPEAKREPADEQGDDD